MSTQAIITLSTVTGLNKCQFYPSYIQLEETNNYCRQSKVTQCILVSTHLNPQPVKHLTANSQLQQRVNHPLWHNLHSHHSYHADPLLSSTSHHHSVLTCPHRCSPKLNATKYFKIMLQLQMLLLTKLLFLKL